VEVRAAVGTAAGATENAAAAETPHITTTNVFMMDFIIVDYSNNQSTKATESWRGEKFVPMWTAELRKIL
jgi:hypothetical protein